MMWRKIGPDGIREKNPSEVDAPIQNNDYSNTYYQINKSNQIEAPYVLGKQGSKKYGWAPKLLFLFFNMTLNNAYMHTKYILYCMNNSINKLKMEAIV